jgi:hypothetical protein
MKIIPESDGKPLRLFCSSRAGLLRACSGSGARDHKERTARLATAARDVARSYAFAAAVSMSPRPYFCFSGGSSS